MDIVTLTHGHPRYTELLAHIRADPELVAAMWRDAESTPDELDVPGNIWTVVCVDGTPAAWAAARIDGGRLKCHSNYEHPAHRGRGLYAAAYRHRNEHVVVPSPLDAFTYLYPQPIHLHLADGWLPTGRSGTGAYPDHTWHELIRPATTGDMSYEIRNDGRTVINELVNWTLAGSNVILERDGIPVARVIAYQPEPDPQPEARIVVRLADPGHEKGPGARS